MHVRDANSRDIFKNNILASQFLKNYTGIPIFADIVPEDVEDVTGKFRAFLGIEYESDAVKKVYIRKKDGSLEKEVYVVSLIEHKRAVDYDVAMQLLHYMCAIWQEHKVAQNKIQEGVSRKKEFRYPLIIPIVYYEGKRKWTAGLHLKDRIEFADEMGKYIPDFTYQVVGVNEYTNEELSEKHDEMSLVMMINKIQTQEDLNKFRKLVSSAFGFDLCERSGGDKGNILHNYRILTEENAHAQRRNRRHNGRDGRSEYGIFIREYG